MVYLCVTIEKQKRKKKRKSRRRKRKESWRNIKTQKCTMTRKRQRVVKVNTRRSTVHRQTLVRILNRVAVIPKVWTERWGNENIKARVSHPVMVTKFSTIKTNDRNSLQRDPNPPKAWTCPRQQLSFQNRKRKQSIKSEEYQQRRV